jgi:hypothetical protein
LAKTPEITRFGVGTAPANHRRHDTPEQLWRVTTPDGGFVARYAVDLDGDGDDDHVVVDTPNAAVSLVDGDERLHVLSLHDGRMDRWYVDMPLDATAVLITDLDGTGGEDLVGIGDEGFFVMLAADDESHRTSHFVLLDRRVAKVDAVDADEDGKTDLAVTFAADCDRPEAQVVFLAEDGLRVPTDPANPKR